MGASSLTGAERRGVQCPACGCASLEVLQTRRAHDMRIIRRRRCRHCGARMTTAEYCVAAQRDRHYR